VPADICPALPEDLLFLREGQLWLCTTEGGAPVAVRVPDTAKSQAVADYTVGADGRYVVTITAAGEAFVLDRVLGEHTLLSTAGRLIDEDGIHMDLTADGPRLLYLAWDVQPTLSSAQLEQSSGTLMMLDVSNPTLRQQHLAFCRGLDDRPCLGFALAPDENAVVLADSRGIWWIGLDQPGDPRLLGHTDDTIVGVRAWAPDGQSVLVEVDAGAGPALVLLSVEAADVPIAASPVCVAPCELQTDWDELGQLWVAWNTPAQGCVAAAVARDAGSPSQPVGVAASVCEVLGTPMRPRSLNVVPDLGATFLQPAGRASYAGIYALPSGGGPYPIALIPGADGTALWSRDGGAFLYADATGLATQIGVLSSGLIWDVAGLLSGAHTFTWCAGVIE